MCGCFPYHAYVIEDAPKKKEDKEKDEWFVVRPGDGFYPLAPGQPATVQYTSTPQAVYCPAPAVAAPGAVPWHGPTRAEVNARNQAIAAANGVYNPRPMIPYKPEDGQQWWCRETDGSYTLRTTTDIMENCKPGRWEYGPAGYPYFIRSSS